MVFGGLIYLLKYEDFTLSALILLSYQDNLYQSEHAFWPFRLHPKHFPNPEG